MVHGPSRHVVQIAAVLRTRTHIFLKKRLRERLRLRLRLRDRLRETDSAASKSILPAAVLSHHRQCIHQATPELAATCGKSGQHVGLPQRP